MLPKIEDLYCWITLEDDGEERILNIELDDGEQQMVCVSHMRLIYEQAIEQVKRQHPKLYIKCYKFTNREEIFE